jgi:hypothetical protein
MRDDIILGVSMIVGVVILYIFVLSYVESRIEKRENGTLESNIKELNDKA